MPWEKKHRPLGPGDVVLFHSGYSDKYYKPLPEGRRFAADPVAGKAPAWPGPDPGLHGVPGQPQGDDAGHRQHQHGPAARPGRADPLRRPEARHDLDRERHGPRGLADDRRVLLHDRPQARRRPLCRRPGLRRRRRSARQAADRVGPQEERGRPVGRPRRQPARRPGPAGASAIIASRT